MSENRKVPDGYSFWWEPMAQRGEDMPLDMPEADKIAFMMLRSLYGQVKQKIITRDMAVKEKKQIIEDYRCYQFQEEMREEWVEIIKLTELARSEFRKNPSIETAECLVKIIEGRRKTA